MNWEELKEKAKELGADIHVDSVFEEGTIHYQSMRFYKSGLIVFDYEYYDQYTDEMIQDETGIAYDRTPEQMLMLMEALT